MSEENIPQTPQPEGVTNPADNPTPPAQIAEETDKNTTPENPTEVTEPQQTQEDYSAVETVEQATEVLEGKGVNYDELTAEYQANGDLLPETYEKLEKLGIPKEVVVAYKQGQEAIVQRTMEDISTVVGGMEQMKTVVDWAKSNLSEDEKKAIDSVHDPAVIKIILKDLQKRMNDSEGIIPQQLQGGAGEMGGDYFRSMAEVEEAIRDPRYSTDPVYRAKTGEKISASREAGVLEIK